MTRVPEGEQPKEENVHARLSTEEKATLDALVAKRGAALAAQGISGQATFGAWLRAMIHREALTEGIRLDATKLSETAKGAKARRKPK